MNATDTNWAMMRPAEFEKLLTRLFANKREEEPLRGSDDRDFILQMLSETGYNRSEALRCAKAVWTCRAFVPPPVLV